MNDSWSLNSRKKWRSCNAMNNAIIVQFSWEKGRIRINLKIKHFGSNSECKFNWFVIIVRKKRKEWKYFTFEISCWWIKCYWNRGVQGSRLVFWLYNLTWSFSLDECFCSTLETCNLSPYVLVPSGLLGVFNKVIIIVNAWCRPSLGFKLCVENPPNLTK